MSTPGPEEAKSGAIDIAGYAIVSDDDRIAGADGLARRPCATKRTGPITRTRWRTRT